MLFRPGFVFYFKKRFKFQLELLRRWNPLPLNQSCLHLTPDPISLHSHLPHTCQSCQSRPWKLLTLPTFSVGKRERKDSERVRELENRRSERRSMRRIMRAKVVQERQCRQVQVEVRKGGDLAWKRRANGPCFFGVFLHLRLFKLIA